MKQEILNNINRLLSPNVYQKSNTTAEEIKTTEFQKTLIQMCSSGTTEDIRNYIQSLPKEQEVDVNFYSVFIEYNNPLLACLLHRKWDNADYLINHLGADVNKDYILTPLLLKDRLDAIQYLYTNNTLFTEEHVSIAARNERRHIVQFLVSKNVPYNDKDHNVLRCLQPCR